MADGQFSTSAAALETIARRAEDVTAAAIDCHILTGLILTGDFKLILKQELIFFFFLAYSCDPLKFNTWSEGLPG